MAQKNGKRKGNVNSLARRQVTLTEKQLGPVCLTRGVNTMMEQHPELEPRLRSLVEAHRRGDWGAVGHIRHTTISERELKGGCFATADTAKQNLIGITRNCGQVFSVYEDEVLGVWIMTELNRRTMVLFPEEY